MRSIDIHAHLTPQCFIHAMQAGQEWHGNSALVACGSAPRAVWTPAQRIGRYELTRCPMYRSSPPGQASITTIGTPRQSLPCIATVMTKFIR